MVQKVNLRQAVDSVSGLFQYLKVGQLNDHMLNVLQVENRTLDFHSHEASDELFYVIEGHMQIEFSDDAVVLNAGDMVIIPAGVVHRPVCTSKVKCLLIEKNGTLTRDNTGGTYAEC